MAAINVDFFLPFVEATHSAFEMMASKVLERKEVYIKKNYVMYGDISGIIGLSGATTGIACISLPASFAVKTIGEMIGEEISGGVNDAVVHDGVGELINLIAGQARTTLSGTRYRFEVSLPTIISGRGHEVYHKQGTCCASMVFESRDNSLFTIDVCMPDGM